MKNWIQKLRAATLLQFDDNMLREFIPLDGGMQPNVQQEGRFNLEECLHSSFVGNPQRKSILLIGSSGIGKTWFGQHLVRRLWDEEVRFIPLWIRLTSIEVPRKELLYQHLNELKKYQIEKGVAKEDCLTDDDIRDFFRHKQPLFLVLDGYDELPLDKREHQYYQENGWNEWGNLVQMLITSRVEALPKIRAPIFAPKAGEPFTEYYLQTFNKNQLEEMVKRYCNLHPALPEGWDASRYLEQFTTLYELREFISKPFLVKVVLDALPLISAEIASSLDQTHTHLLLKKRLTRSHLYKKFLEQHFVRESDRLIRMGVGKKIEIRHNAHLPENSELVTLPQLLEKFTSNLAQDMFNCHVSTVKWHPATPPTAIPPSFTATLTSSSRVSIESGSNPDWLKPYFDEALSPYAEHLRSGSPIVSVGFHEYAFLHYSILEFYAAEQLFNGALQDSWYLTERNLNKENLQTTPDVLKNLIGRLREEPLLEEKLFEIIEQSKYIPEIWRAAANAITILNGAGVCLSGRDFKRIRIGGLEDPNDPQSGWGADLSHSVLSETNLSEADLRYVNLTQAHLVNAILTGACLDRVNFGEQSRIEGSRFAFAGNGQSLVTQVGDGLKIYSWPSRKLEGEFSVVCNRSTEDWSSSIRGFASHPTGQQVAVIKHTYWYEKYPNQYEIDLWDVRQQRCISTLFSISERVDCITYSPDGNRLATSVNSVIHQWDIKTGTCLLKIKPKSGVNCLAYSPDGDWLASGSEYYDTIQQWNAVTGRSLQTYIGHHRGGVNCVVYHPKGSRLASGGQDGAVREWNVMTGELLQVHRGRDGGVVSIAYNPDGSRLVSVQNHIVQEWDTIIGVSLRTYDWKWINDNKVTYSPDGRYLIFTERHGLLGPSLEGIRQYDIATPAPLKTRENLTHSITGIVYSADGTRITSVGGNVIQEWDVISGALLQSYEVGRGVGSITYNQSGRLAAGGSSTIWQWNIKIGNSFQSYQVKNGADYIAYSPDGSRLASAGADDPVVQQLNADTGAVFCLHKGFNEKIYCVAYSPDGKRLVAGGASSNSQSKSIVLREWNAVTGEILRTYKTASVYKNHIDSVNSVSYSYDSQRLASGHTKVAREWNITTGALLRTFEYEESEFGNSIAYSPNDRYLAFGTESIVHIANMDRVNSSKAVFKLKKAHIGSIYALAWSLDSTKLATGGSDCAVRLWRVCDAAGKINPVLLWQTHSFLASQGLRIHQATGLSDDNYKLLKESVSDVPLQGTPANPKFLTSEKVLAERNKQIHLPKGELPIGPVGNSDSYLVTPDDWLISMVRLKDVKPKNRSDLTGYVGGHVWLLLIGLDEKHFTIFQEIHFYLDTDAPISGSVFKSGRGLISVRHRVPYDLFPELAARKYEAKSWMISRSQAQQLCANVEKDRLTNLPYVNTGHTFFGAPGFSCVTFCEKHLKEIGCIALEEKEKRWYDFFIALPNNYLPTTSPEPTTTASKCPLM